ncbi:MAG: hypothetical protein MUE33_10195 [Cytophagaceae bacterium]|nr:hypothetical protein [Cytophagaceae bacterium]
MTSSKKRLAFIGIHFVFLLFITQCTGYNTNIGRRQVYHYPSSAYYFSLRSTPFTMGVEAQYFTLQKGYQTVEGKKGTFISLDTDCLQHEDGSGADSALTLMLKECYTKTDLVVEQAYTRSNGALLESAGSIYLTISDCKGALYFKCSEGMTIQMPSSNVDPDMAYFSGTRDEEGKMNWVLQDSIVSISTLSNENDDWIEGPEMDEPLTQEMKGYLFQTKQLGWINCDKFYDSKGDKRPLLLSLPEIAKGYQRNVFVVFTDRKSVLPAYPINGQYKTDSIPVGEALTILCLDTQSDNVYLGVVKVVSGSESVFVPTSKVPRKELEQKLEDIL